jgi:hypothetical protein
VAGGFGDGHRLIMDLSSSVSPHSAPTTEKRDTMAKPNFAFQKRQKELEKKKKNEEKLQRKQEKKSSPGEEGEEETDEAVADEPVTAE